ncbi:MAG: RNA methyltransferase [bacterium]|nr:RNA methyltransferase [bacterium]
MNNRTGDLTRPVWERSCGPQVRIVLVAPRNPGNIGAACRAIRVCGFDELAIVDNQLPLDKGTDYAMAWGSLDILEQSLKVDTLEEALVGCHFAIATSARPRRHERELFTPKELAKKLTEVPMDARVALVFGREDTGLDNEEMERCAWWSRIPSAAVYPCYNLAQSVQIYCYEMFSAFSEAKEIIEQPLANPNNIEWLYRRIREKLEGNGFFPRDGMDEFINHTRRVLGDVVINEHNTAFLHKLLDGLHGERTH